MALLYGANYQQQSAAANKPHIFQFLNARAAADDTLLEVWNGTTNAARKAVIDLNGKYYSAALAVGDILYAVAGGVANVKRLDSLAIGAANRVLTSTGVAPQWSTALSIVSLTATGSITVTGNGTSVTITDALAAGTAPTVKITGPTGTATGPSLLLVTPGATANGAPGLILTDVETNATQKQSSISLRHFTAAEEDFRLVAGVAGAAFNNLRLGGGSAAFNAATAIEFYCAANNTTVTGTLMATFSTTGLTMSAGAVITLASANGGAGFRLPHGIVPAAPVDGDMWTTAAGGAFIRINGVTKTFTLT